MLVDLQVWHLDAADGARGSKEVASHYVYESVKSMVVDWTAPGGGSAFLGSRSGSISLWQLETGRKLQVRGRMYFVHVRKRF